YLAMFSFSWGLARTIAPGVVAALLWVGPTALWLGVIGFCMAMAGIAWQVESEIPRERQLMPRRIRNVPSDMLSAPSLEEAG
ncbi:MAG TPA: hypothetical protein PK819_13360, partial [Thermomicrobiales bacterium]|nr:hypothetical protein [Thermomicrobiales bacterium]